MTTDLALPSSFRDPSGYVLRYEGRLLRQVSVEYAPTLDKVVSSGLYEGLVAKGLLVPHRVVSSPFVDGAVYLEPEEVPFIGYPYEWCFSQLKEAALATLQIQKLAISKGFTLKDASAYNIAFHNGKPTLIDSLSFEEYKPGKPWRAYRQFCEHFLAPLALRALVDPRLGKLSRIHLDGVPLDLAAKMLPGRSKLSPGLAMHIHMHARAQSSHARQTPSSAGNRAFSEVAMLGLIDSLEGAVRKLDWKPEGTVWGDYYDNTNYTIQSMVAKRELVAGMLDGIEPRPAKVWDLGANTGEFSKLAAGAGAYTVSWDCDEAAVERSYLENRSIPNLLPLIVDLTNPSPGLGWDGRERESFFDRCDADVVLALALIHHLAIGNNVPLSKLADSLARLSPWLIVEFVPKGDSQVDRLLSTRDDIYVDYHEEGFMSAFARRFELVSREPIPGAERVLFLMRRR